MANTIANTGASSATEYPALDADPHVDRGGDQPERKESLGRRDHRGGSGAAEPPRDCKTDGQQRETSGDHFDRASVGPLGAAQTYGRTVRTSQSQRPSGRLRCSNVVSDHPALTPTARTRVKMMLPVSPVSRHPWLGAASA